MLEYRIAARRIDAGTSLASTKMTEIRMDTGIAGSPDAFNPAELLLAAVAACMIKGIERVTPMLDFKLDGVEVSLHKNVRKYGTISNTVAAAARFEGTIRRKS